MSDLASLLRFAQQNSQAPRLDINPAAGLGAGSLSSAYQAISQAQPSQPLFQPQTLPVPPPQMATFTPFPEDGDATPLFQPQYLPAAAPAPFQGSGAGKGGPIVKGAGPSAGAGSVTSALARIGMLGG